MAEELRDEMRVKRYLLEEGPANGAWQRARTRLRCTPTKSAQRFCTARTRSENRNRDKEKDQMKGDGNRRGPK